jgi:CubicO group peptidase (beta-lactamase class C family)
VAILQLRDAGKLGLDDAVQKHLPDYPAATASRSASCSPTPPASPTTPTDLARARRRPRHPCYPAADPRASRTSALEFPPGTDFDPSNSGYFLLGQSSRPVKRPASVDYLAPASSRPPACATPPRRATRLNDANARRALATGHEFSEDEVLVPLHGLDLSVYGGAAGIVSTPADLVRWDLALRTPGLLLSPPRSTRCSPPCATTTASAGSSRRSRGQTFVGHPGGVEGFNAAISRYLGDGVTVIALANTEAIDCRDIVLDTARSSYGEQSRPPTSSTTRHLSLRPCSRATSATSPHRALASEARRRRRQGAPRPA